MNMSQLWQPKWKDPVKVHSIMCSFEEVKSEVPDIKIDEVVTDLNQERPPSEETLAKFEAQLTDIFNKVENKLNNFCVQFSTNSPSKTSKRKAFDQNHFVA
ncbi:hypothetical protein ACOSQ2_012695 [Xanthoceras sorbifolium]